MDSISDENYIGEENMKIAFIYCRRFLINIRNFYPGSDYRFSR